MAAEEPQLSDPQYREYIPLIVKHREENAADAVIADETTAEWKASAASHKPCAKAPESG